MTCFGKLCDLVGVELAGGVRHQEGVLPARRPPGGGGRRGGVPALPGTPAPAPPHVVKDG